MRACFCMYVSTLMAWQDPHSVSSLPLPRCPLRSTGFACIHLPLRLGGRPQNGKSSCSCEHSSHVASVRLLYKRRWMVSECKHRVSNCFQALQEKMTGQRTKPALPSSPQGRMQTATGYHTFVSVVQLQNRYFFSLLHMKSKKAIAK